MKYLILLTTYFFSLSLNAQVVVPQKTNFKEPEFTGFFAGAMAYTDIYPAPNYIFQINAGATFKTKTFLFDIVPVQVSYIQNNNFKFGSSILLRKYLFKKQ